MILSVLNSKHNAAREVLEEMEEERRGEDGGVLGPQQFYSSLFGNECCSFT